MAAVERRPSANNLAAPFNRSTSKGTGSSAVSLASSEGHAADDLNKSNDGSMERVKSEAASDTSSHRRRMSRLFKGRNKRRKSGSADDLSRFDTNEEIPPVPDLKAAAGGPRNYSDDSLGLAKSVTSSLLTEDSDPEA